ncbi:MAG TPA: AlkA N-terminal domain-containing protein [Pyrinomonadaceae bacterium]|jgi:DNA-3-methyladenine glycosylase II|nr:AlkA N-terminal domain-containing protein [Pyrinomonadaceae bacterium]
MPTLKIAPRPPFDFHATARFFRFTEAEIVDNFDAGTYARACHFGDELLLLRVRSEGTRARPALAVSLSPARGGGRGLSAEAGETVRRMFSVDHDLKLFREQVSADPLMSRLEAEHRGLRLPRWATLFEALLNSILLQQIATPVAWTLRRRVVERFGAQVSVAGRRFYAFPLPSAMARAPAEELRALGLSGAKAQGIVELARAVEAGALDAGALAREDNEGVIARLSALRGVGRWTAEWVLMLHFGRTDVFAAADLFLRGAFVKYYNGGEPLSEREIRARSLSLWGAWGSYVALYMLAGMRAGKITLKSARVVSSNSRGA